MPHRITWGGRGTLEELYGNDPQVILLRCKRCTGTFVRPRQLDGNPYPQSPIPGLKSEYTDILCNSCRSKYESREEIPPTEAYSTPLSAPPAYFPQYQTQQKPASFHHYQMQPQYAHSPQYQMQQQSPNMFGQTTFPVPFGTASPYAGTGMDAFQPQRRIPTIPYGNTF